MENVASDESLGSSGEVRKASLMLRECLVSGHSLTGMTSNKYIYANKVEIILQKYYSPDN